MIVTVVCDVLGAENNGTTIAAMNLIRSLRARGHTVRVVCPDESRRGREGVWVVPAVNFGPLNGYVRHNGVTIGRGDRSILREAIADADIVHLMIPFSLSRAALRCAKECGKPVSAGFHCQAENITSHLFLMNSGLASRAAYRAMYRLIYRHVDAIHYPTQFIRDVFEAEVGPTPGYVISNGVNSRFVPGTDERPEAWKDRFVILSTGRYSREKSQEVLIEAVRRCRHEGEIQLVLAGAGPLESALRKAGSALTHPPELRFFSREELLRVIHSADLYVHAAEIEIESIACLEAISCGLVPVIADSPRSATRAFALEEGNLFRCNDPQALAERIDWWIEHPEERRRSSQAYRGFTRQFEQEKCMDAMERMLLETAGRVSA